MESHRDNHRFKDWNLEATSQILSEHFPNSHIWVIKPKEMHLKTFSVFSNFLQFEGMNNPIFSDDFGSWKHLKHLLLNATEEVNKLNSQSAENCFTPVKCTADVPLSLIGFSKGTVVLNQLLHELNSATEDPITSDIVEKVSHMIYLDGGHNGGKDVWITKESVLQNLQGTGIAIETHVTPYQMNDPMRKWMKTEHKRFVQGLQKLGVNVATTKHFEGEERSIDIHFGILKAFRN